MVNAIQTLWKGKCSVYIKEDTTFSGEALIENEPCRIAFRLPFRLSLKTTSSDIEDFSVTHVQQTVNLFISSKFNIPIGSKIVATQNGVAGIYRSISKPSIYTYFQEILLENF